MPEGRAARLQGLPGWRWGSRRGDSPSATPAAAEATFKLKLGAGYARKWEDRFLALQAFLSESGGHYPSRGAAVPVRPPAAFYIHYA